MKAALGLTLAVVHLCLDLVAEIGNLRRRAAGRVGPIVDAPCGVAGSGRPAIKHVASPFVGAARLAVYRSLGVPDGIHP